tara:strand:+ start:68 stop:796 length:729 start_codon:yes stop_codon:yes gene_type:complete
MYLNIRDFSSFSNFGLLVKLIFAKLLYRDLISFSLFYNIAVSLKSSSFESSNLTVLDIGANKGQFAFMSSYLLPSAKLISYEPQHCLESSLISLKKILGSRFTYHLKAVSSVSKPVAFNCTANHEQSSLLLPLQYSSSQVTVDAIGINDVLDSIKTDVFLKIDTQGHELQILSSIHDRNKHKLKFLLLEAAIFPSYCDQPTIESLILSLRDDFGFNGVQFVDMLFDKASNYPLECDLLFIRN